MESLREKRGSGVLLHKPQNDPGQRVIMVPLPKVTSHSISTFHRQQQGMKFSMRFERVSDGWIQPSGQSNLKHRRFIQAVANHADDILQEQGI